MPERDYMVVQCLVSCVGPGPVAVPAFHPVLIYCTYTQYELAEHCEAALNDAHELGFDVSRALVYDNHDPVHQHATWYEPLFNSFNWHGGTTVVDLRPVTTLRSNRETDVAGKITVCWKALKGEKRKRLCVDGPNGPDRRYVLQEIFDKDKLLELQERGYDLRTLKFSIARQPAGHEPVDEADM